jgi:hypothetical protein
VIRVADFRKNSRLRLVMDEEHSTAIAYLQSTGQETKKVNLAL